MVHLRIVVPSYEAEHALELLNNTPLVCNLICLERAAQRPEGDWSMSRRPCSRPRGE
jgi:hypothetical protein